MASKKESTDQRSLLYVIRACSRTFLAVRCNNGCVDMVRCICGRSGDVDKADRSEVSAQSDEVTMDRCGEGVTERLEREGRECSE